LEFEQKILMPDDPLEVSIARDLASSLSFTEQSSCQHAISWTPNPSINAANSVTDPNGGISFVVQHPSRFKHED